MQSIIQDGTSEIDIEHPQLPRYASPRSLPALQGFVNLLNDGPHRPDALLVPLIECSSGFGLRAPNHPGHPDFASSPVFWLSEQPSQVGVVLVIGHGSSMPINTRFCR